MNKAICDAYAVLDGKPLDAGLAKAHDTIVAIVGIVGSSRHSSFELTPGIG